MQQNGFIIFEYLVHSKVVILPDRYLKTRPGSFRNPKIDLVTGKNGSPETTFNYSTRKGQTSGANMHSVR